MMVIMVMRGHYGRDDDRDVVVDDVGNKTCS